MTYEELFDTLIGHAVVLLPISLCIVQPFLKSVHYDLVNSFSLSVPLRISWSGIPVCNSQFTAISPKRLAVELKSIVRDERIRYFEVGDNVLLDKFLYVHISDIY